MGPRRPARGAERPHEQADRHTIQAAGLPADLARSAMADQLHRRLGARAVDPRSPRSLAHAQEPAGRPTGRRFHGTGLHGVLSQARADGRFPAIRRRAYARSGTGVHAEAAHLHEVADEAGRRDRPPRQASGQPHPPVRPQQPRRIRLDDHVAGAAVFQEQPERQPSSCTRRPSSACRIPRSPACATISGASRAT